MFIKVGAQSSLCPPTCSTAVSLRGCHAGSANSNAHCGGCAAGRASRRVLDDRCVRSSKLRRPGPPAARGSVRHVRPRAPLLAHAPPCSPTCPRDPAALSGGRRRAGAHSGDRCPVLLQEDHVSRRRWRQVRVQRALAWGRVWWWRESAEQSAGVARVDAVRTRRRVFARRALCRCLLALPAAVAACARHALPRERVGAAQACSTAMGTGSARAGRRVPARPVRSASMCVPSCVSWATDRTPHDALTARLTMPFAPSPLVQHEARFLRVSRQHRQDGQELLGPRRLCVL